MMSQADYDEGMRAVIARSRWGLQGVGAGETQPNFTYTVGLTAFDLPEVIMFGLDFATSAQLLNDLARQAVDGKLPLVPGECPNIASVPLRLIAVDDPTEHMQTAIRIAGPDRAVRALQLVWPDVRGFFPWQDGFECSFTVPLLGVPA